MDSDGSTEWVIKPQEGTLTKVKIKGWLHQSLRVHPDAVSGVRRCDGGWLVSFFEAADCATWRMFGAPFTFPEPAGRPCLPRRSDQLPPAQVTHAATFEHATGMDSYAKRCEEKLENIHLIEDAAVRDTLRALSDSDVPVPVQESWEALKWVMNTSAEQTFGVTNVSLPRKPKPRLSQEFFRWHHCLRRVLRSLTKDWGKRRNYHFTLRLMPFDVRVRATGTLSSWADRVGPVIHHLLIAHRVRKRMEMHSDEEIRRTDWTRPSCAPWALSSGAPSTARCAKALGRTGLRTNWEPHLSSRRPAWTPTGRYIWPRHRARPQPLALTV